MVGEGLILAGQNNNQRNLAQSGGMRRIQQGRFAQRRTTGGRPCAATNSVGLVKGGHTGPPLRKNLHDLTVLLS